MAKTLVALGVLLLGAFMVLGQFHSGVTACYYVVHGKAIREKCHYFYTGFPGVTVTPGGPIAVNT